MAEVSVKGHDTKLGKRDTWICADFASPSSTAGLLDSALCMQAFQAPSRLSAGISITSCVAFWCRAPKSGANVEPSSPAGLMDVANALEAARCRSLSTCCNVILSSVWEKLRSSPVSAILGGTHGPSAVPAVSFSASASPVDRSLRGENRRQAP